MSRRMPADFFRSRNKLLGLGLAVIALAVVVAGVLGGAAFVIIIVIAVQVVLA